MALQFQCDSVETCILSFLQVICRISIFSWQVLECSHSEGSRASIWTSRDHSVGTVHTSFCFDICDNGGNPGDVKGR